MLKRADVRSDTTSAPLVVNWPRRRNEVRAEEAKRISNRTIKLVAEDVYANIRDLSVRGCYSAVFDQRQMTEHMKQDLKMKGYRLIEQEYTITVAWNG